MANPQPDRYTKLSNELLQAFYKARMFGHRARVLFWVIRHSYGWNRKWAPDPGPREIGRQMEMDHSHVIKTLKGLVRAGILKREGDRFYLVKDYEKWLVESGDNPVDNEWCRIRTGAESAPISVQKVHHSGAESAPHINKVVKDSLNTRKTVTRADSARVADINPLIAEFQIALRTQLKETPTSFNRGAAAKNFKRLLAAYPKHEIQARFNQWFSSTDEHIARRGWRVEDFFTYFNRLKEGPILKRDLPDRRKDGDAEYQAEKKRREELNARADAIIGRRRPNS